MLASFLPLLRCSCTPKCEMVPRPATAPLRGLASGADSLPKELFAAALQAPNSITFDFGEIEDGATLLLMLYFVEASPGTVPALPAAPASAACLTCGCTPMRGTAPCS